MIYIFFKCSFQFSKHYLNHKMIILLFKSWILVLYITLSRFLTWTSLALMGKMWLIMEILNENVDDFYVDFLCELHILWFYRKTLKICHIWLQNSFDIQCRWKHQNFRLNRLSWCHPFWQLSNQYRKRNQTKKGS